LLSTLLFLLPLLGVMLLLMFTNAFAGVANSSLVPAGDLTEFPGVVALLVEPFLATVGGVAVIANRGVMGLFTFLF
jgi:hypothetical protein